MVKKRDSLETGFTLSESMRYHLAPFHTVAQCADIVVHAWMNAGPHQLKDLEAAIQRARF